MLKNNLIFCFASFIVVFLCTSHPAFGQTFEDISIFEDEDIYSDALTPHWPLNVGWTLPGTKWCGPGTKAANYNDLGTQRETDMCCREHDHCDQIIPSTVEKYGVHNTGSYPIMSCACEQKFLNCLQDVTSAMADTIGRAYFMFTDKCIKMDHPIIECTERQRGMVRSRCIRYKVDKSQPKIMQLFDVPYYSSSSTKQKTTSV